MTNWKRKPEIVPGIMFDGTQASAIAIGQMLFDNGVPLRAEFVVHRGVTTFEDGVAKKFDQPEVQFHYTDGSGTFGLAAVRGCLILIDLEATWPRIEDGVFWEPTSEPASIIHQDFTQD
jgi:hypothetical protein